MTRYLIGRVLQAIPLLVGISVVVFVMLQMTPGGPLAVTNDTGGGRVTAEDLARLRASYGLDQPIYLQYLHWAGRLVRGDWGTSFSTGRPVLTTIFERLPATSQLVGFGFLLAIAISFPIGILAAMRPHTVFDYVSTTIAFLGVSIPQFWLALLLLELFALELRWLPTVGLNDLQHRYTGAAFAWDRVSHLVLPVAILGFAAAAGLTRYIRAGMLEVINQDYIRTARAKGLSERATVGVHALKNGVIPVVTILALQIPDLFIGAVVIEQIFAISGMGRLYVDSANMRDYPVLMGIVVIVAALAILSNLVADIAYGMLDPRIRYHE